MMVVYGGLLVVLALALALFPFLRPGARAGADRAQMVRAIYRGRLNELDAEITAGQLSEDTRAEVEQELGAALLADFSENESETETGETSEKAGRATSRWVSIVVVVMLPLTSSAVYLSLGDPGAMDLAGAGAVLHFDAKNHGDVLGDWQSRLSTRIAAKPQDAESWYLLGHVELKLGNFQRAAEAFAEAHEFHGDDPSIDLYWIQARYLASGGQIDQQTSALGQRILKSSPNQPLVLEMFAINAFRRGDFKTSVTFLNRALTNPLAPAQRQVLDAGFAEARKKLGALAPSIDVEIFIEGEMPEGATLFVIARPPGGGMPFAVVKRPLDRVPTLEAPMTIRLDDAVSMNPAAGLSGAEEIQVVVRLSRSGAAMAQPGDWEWRSKTIKLAEIDNPHPLKATLKATLKRE